MKRLKYGFVSKCLALRKNMIIFAAENIKYKDYGNINPRYSNTLWCDGRTV